MSFSNHNDEKKDEQNTNTNNQNGGIGHVAQAQ